MKRLKRQIPAQILAGLIGFALAFAACGDEVITAGGIAQAGCRVISSDGITLHYVDGQGRDHRRPLSEIEGVKLDDFPDYYDAVVLVAKGQDPLARRHLVNVLAKARGRAEWLAADVAQRLSALHDRAGDGAAAAQVYLDAASRQPPSAYLETPPLRSVSAMPSSARRALIPRIDVSLRSHAGQTVAAQALQRLRQAALTGVNPAAADPPTAPASASPVPTPGRPPSGPAYDAQAPVLLPQRLPSSDIADLLVAGQPDAAFARADAALRQRANDEVLYLRAVARLQAAERSRSVAGYKDAGLDFLRVVVIFPKSPYVGPALVEAAYVHQQLDLPAAAAALLEEARSHLNPQDTPRYDARRRALLRAGEP